MSDPRDRAKEAARRGVLRVATPLRRIVSQRDRLERQNRALTAQVEGFDARLHDLTAQRERLSREVAELRAGAELDNYGYLFVIAYGRSGSTLLQGILNSIPGYLIRGENNDAFFRLGDWHRVLVMAKGEHQAAVRPTYAWYGIGGYDIDASLTMMRGLALHTLLKPEPDTRVIGYKEIRWWHTRWAWHLEFLRALFPGARFVLINRNHENVAQSKWWADRPDAMERLGRYEKQLDQMAAALGDAGYRVNFDEFVADPDVLRGMFAWLGEEFDRARLDAVMAVKHSS